MSIHIQIERFEGPMALLLHLIRKEEMDIFDINIHHITRQYMEYVRAMKQLDLEMAGDFVAMASTLIQIKSRMLLPQYDEDGEEVETEDPRKELVQRLLEYQRYQAAASELYERPLLNRDVWVRGQKESLSQDAEEEIVVEENPLFALISAYRGVIRNMKQSVHTVGVDLQSIASRVSELKNRLKSGSRILFQSLIDAPQEKRRSQVLVTFLSMLELAKMGFVSLFQSNPCGDIHVEARKAIDQNVIGEVEDYDSAYEDSEKAADKILKEPSAEPQSDEGEQMDVAATDEEIVAEESRLELNEPSLTGEGG